MSHLTSPAPSPREIIGLMPSGGQANRLAPLPASKELYPIGFRSTDEGLRPKVVCAYLLEAMQRAGVSKTYIILREGKWDIPAYLKDGAMLAMPLAYLLMNLPFGVPYTVDQAYPFVRHGLIAFGFPDIIFQPEDAFTTLITHQTDTAADLVLGLFPTDYPQKADMVEFDRDGRLRKIVIKPEQTDLVYTWIIAVWTPTFTEFMHNYVQLAYKRPAYAEADPGATGWPELYIGRVFQAAIDAGLKVEYTLFREGNFLDIGTPEDLVRAIDRSTIQLPPTRQT
ncbi:MAG: dTDP-glucose pyrophosphorylase [Anaerolineae bacterium]|nr:dTDP-glucose pyrophosphorylase [Anaerolineae bacterium]